MPRVILAPDQVVAGEGGAHLSRPGLGAGGLRTHDKWEWTLHFSTRSAGVDHEAAGVWQVCEKDPDGPLERAPDNLILYLLLGPWMLLVSKEPGRKGL